MMIMTAELLINNQWHQGRGATFASNNPANNEIVWQGAAADDSQVDLSVTCARDAFPLWANKSFSERVTVIMKFVSLLKESAKDMAETISIETGKPLWETHTEVAGMLTKAKISIDAYHERTGTKKLDISPNVSAHLRHKPHGVVAVFGPFNFPGHLPNGHIIPALLAGNTIVFKPSELTPLVAKKTLELWLSAGLPPGVLNLVQGKKNTGIVLAQHEGVDGIFFTGSSCTGHILHKQHASCSDKILALEMGGNNPLIIGEISNLKAAVYETIQSAFITAGQRCTCARRMYVPQNTTGDAFLTALIQSVSKIKVGAWNDDPQPFMGSLISQQAAEAILEAQESLIMSGANSLVKVEQIIPDTAFINPGLIDVSYLSHNPDKEYFGPLLQIVRYKSFEKAVEMANRTRYGLSAGLFSDDKSQFDYFYRHIRAGIVNWNRQLTGASGSMPFGGVGSSGNHRPGAYYAADYCAYPVASIETQKLMLPDITAPGINLVD